MEHTRHTCQTCGHIFDSDQELKQHLRSAHGPEATEDEKGSSQSKQKQERAA